MDTTYEEGFADGRDVGRAELEAEVERLKERQRWCSKESLAICKKHLKTIAEAKLLLKQTVQYTPDDMPLDEWKRRRDALLKTGGE